MTQRSVQHDTIVIKRRLAAPLERAFTMWSHPEGWDDPYEHHEFRVGGCKRQTFGPPGERIYREEGRYEDIVPNKRVVYTYSIWRGEVRITTSLQTVEFAAQGARTEFLLTDQIAILDAGDTAAAREHGIGKWLDQFEAGLQRS
jgi:uncharacterized protein YndB with AHSA1/START domain